MHQFFLSLNAFTHGVRFLSLQTISQVCCSRKMIVNPALYKLYPNNFFEAATSSKCMRFVNFSKNSAAFFGSERRLPNSDNKSIINDLSSARSMFVIFSGISMFLRSAISNLPNSTLRRAERQVF